MDTFSSCHTTLAISNRNRTLRLARKKKGYVLGYGRLAVKSGKGGSYSWTVKIDQVRSDIIIGLALNNNINASKANVHIGLSKQGYKCYSSQSKKYCGGFKKGDTVTLNVNFTARTLSFAVNDKSQGLAFDLDQNSIGPIYYFCVCVKSWSDVGDGVTLQRSSKKAGAKQKKAGANLKKAGANPKKDVDDEKQRHERALDTLKACRANSKVISNRCKSHRASTRRR